MVRLIFFVFVFLLGTWVQSTGACPEAYVAPAPAQKAIPIAVSAVSGDFAAIEGDHRCECSATMQDAQSIVSNSAKSLLSSYAGGSSVFLNPLNPPSVAPAERDRATSFLARPSGRPPYLLLSHLRQ